MRPFDHVTQSVAKPSISFVLVVLLALPVSHLLGGKLPREAICRVDEDGVIHTIVNGNAVRAHLAHVDALGPCPE